MRPGTRLVCCLFVSALFHAPLIFLPHSPSSTPHRQERFLPVDLIATHDRLMLSSVLKAADGTLVQSDPGREARPIRTAADASQNTPLGSSEARVDRRYSASTLLPDSASPQPVHSEVSSAGSEEKFNSKPLTEKKTHRVSDRQPNSQDVIDLPQEPQDAEVSLGTHAGSVSDPAADLRDEYLARVKREVEKHWEVLSEMGSNEGTTVLLVLIDPDGSLRSVDLHQSSGMILRDVEAMEAVKKSFPFQPPPPSLLNRKGRLLIRFSFHYSVGPTS